MLLKSISIILPLLATSFLTSTVHAEIYEHKLAQYGDPTTLPKTRTSCVKYAKMDLPFGGGIKTCVGWKTEVSTYQVSWFIRVEGPDIHVQAIKDAAKSALDSCTNESVATAVATFAITPGEFSIRLTVSLTAFNSNFSQCIKRIPDKTIRELGERYKAKLDHRGHWSDWSGDNKGGGGNNANQEPSKGSHGWYLEGLQTFIPSQGSPLYRYWNPKIGDHFYTANFDELGNGKDDYHLEGVAGHIFLDQKPTTIPLYRYWNPGAGDHFYTTNFDELGNGKHGYTYEGIAGYVCTSQKGPHCSNSKPFYRYNNPQIGDHFYTSNGQEL